MITKAMAENCTTHFLACECREWKFKQMELALGYIVSMIPKGVDEVALYSIRKIAMDAIKEADRD
jgi:hypothetical protein